MAEPLLMRVSGIPTTPQTVGDMLRLTLFLTDYDLVSVDPGVLTFSYIEPGGTTATDDVYPSGTIVRDSAGVYTMNLSLDLNGVYRLRWSVAPDTGYQGAAESLITVADSAFD